MPACIPALDLKNAADFVCLDERESDEAVAENSYGAIRCPSEAGYRAVREERAKAQLLSRVMLAEEELAQGESLDLNDFTASVRAEHGL